MLWHQFPIAYILSNLVYSSFSLVKSLRQVYLICIIIPDQAEVEKWATANGKEVGDYESFIKTEEFKAEIESRIKQMCKEKNVSSF